MNTAQRIRYRRKQLGLSQEALAELTGISQKQISRYETGQSDLTGSTLVSLADALDATVDWLLCRTDTVKPVIMDNLDTVELEALELLHAQTPDQREKIMKAIKALM